jgi:hypothetical protein
MTKDVKHTNDTKHETRMARIVCDDGQGCDAFGIKMVLRERSPRFVALRTTGAASRG